MKESLQSERFLHISQAAFAISGCQQGSKFDRNRRSSKIKNFEEKHSEKTSVERSCLIKVDGTINLSRAPFHSLSPQN